MSLLENIRSLLTTAGTDGSVLTNINTAHLVADGQKLLSERTTPGIEITAQQSPEITSVQIKVARARHILNPVHLCFGMLKRTGTQNFKLRIVVEPYAQVCFVAHGLFTRVDSLKHIMDQSVEIGEGAKMCFTDGHFHSFTGNIELLTSANIKVGKQAEYLSDFSLTTGCVGRLNLDYSVVAQDHAVIELTSRIFGHADDDIKLNEQVNLAGRFSRSLIKSRIALEDRAKAEITGTTHGCAEGARGHMDCREIIKGQAVGQSTPTVKVSHPLAKITHEAAIGTIDCKQLETLIAHGLTAKQATDMIVLGMLR